MEPFGITYERSHNHTNMCLWKLTRSIIHIGFVLCLKMAFGEMLTKHLIISPNLLKRNMVAMILELKNGLILTI